MDKYIAIFKIKIRNTLQYKFDFVVVFLSSILPLVVLYFFWKEIYKNGSSINGMDFKSMFTYYILATLLTMLFQGNTSWEVSDEIRTGEINSIIIKPYEYIRLKFISYLADQTIIILIITVLLVLNLTCVSIFLGVSSLINLLLFIISIIMGMLILFHFAFFIGIVTFWWNEIKGLFYFQALILQFFSGSIIPLDWYPSYLKEIVKLLPFSYTVYFPIKLYLGQIEGYEILKNFTLLALWLLILHIVCCQMWKHGTKNYNAYGG